MFIATKPTSPFEMFCISKLNIILSGISVIYTEDKCQGKYSYAPQAGENPRTLCSGETGRPCNGYRATCTVNSERIALV